MAAESAELARARGLFEANKFSEAQIAFEKLSASAPSESDVHYYLGRLALVRGDAHAAVIELEKAVVLAPDNARDHNALGEAYGRSAEKAGIFGKFSLARKCVAEFQRAVALDPNNVGFHESLFKYYSQAPTFLGGGSSKAAAEAAIIKKLQPRRAP